MTSALALKPEDSAIDHEASLVVKEAASKLIARNDETPTDIEFNGSAKDVLDDVTRELRKAGLSEHEGHELGAYVEEFGKSFINEMKIAGEQLRARVVVTNESPKDMTEDELCAVMLLNGSDQRGNDFRKFGLDLKIDGGGQGASSTRGSVQRMFKNNKQTWMMVYFGSSKSGTMKGMDLKDKALDDLAQAAQAGKLDPAELKAAVEQGLVSPQMAELVSSVAELNSITAAAQTPGAVENTEAKITELKVEIAEISSKITAVEPLPEAIADTVSAAVMQADATTITAETVNSFSATDAAPVSLNDNMPAQEGAAVKADAAPEQAAVAGGATEIVMEKNATQPGEAKLQVGEIATEKMEIAAGTLDVAAQELSVRDTDIALNDNNPLGEKVERVIELSETVLQKDGLSADMKETLADRVSIAADTLRSDNMDAAIQSVSAIRETMTGFAMADSISPQAFGQIAQVLPSIAVAEKQMTDMRDAIVENRLTVAPETPSMKDPAPAQAQVQAAPAVVISTQPEMQKPPEQPVVAKADPIVAQAIPAVEPARQVEAVIAKPADIAPPPSAPEAVVQKPEPVSPPPAVVQQEQIRLPETDVKTGPAPVHAEITTEAAKPDTKPSPPTASPETSPPPALDKPVIIGETPSVIVPTPPPIVVVPNLPPVQLDPVSPPPPLPTEGRGPDPDVRPPQPENRQPEQERKDAPERKPDTPEIHDQKPPIEPPQHMPVMPINERRDPNPIGGPVYTKPDDPFMWDKNPDKPPPPPPPEKKCCAAGCGGGGCGEPFREAVGHVQEAKARRAAANQKPANDTVAAAPQPKAM